ncbi:MAG: outer membrane beta-barrel protein [Opitutae bacterium]
MKNKLIAVLAAFGMVASASAVKVNDNLSINGFIDGSYASTDTDGAAKTQSLEIDEVEVNFVLNVGNVSGLVALDADISDANGGTNVQPNLGVEQAHFSYNINDAVSVTFGRYGSALGLEREDPAGLYTYSRAYNDATAQGNAFNLGNVDANAFEGLSFAYSADTFSVGVSLQNDAGAEADLQDNDIDFEVSFAYTGIAGVNIGGGFRIDNEDNGDRETDVVNLHISRQFGKLLLAGEYAQLDIDANGDALATTEELDAYTILADYDVNDKLGVALRISSQEQTGATADYDKVTIAPNYAITDSLGAIIEYSDVDNAGTDSEEIAIELTYTF